MASRVEDLEILISSSSMGMVLISAPGSDKQMSSRPIIAGEQGEQSTYSGET